MGTRSDVGSMFAIGSIKEDYLGSVNSRLLLQSMLILIGHFESRDLNEVLLTIGYFSSPPGTAMRYA